MPRPTLQKHTHWGTKLLSREACTGILPLGSSSTTCNPIVATWGRQFLAMPGWLVGWLLFCFVRCRVLIFTFCPCLSTNQFDLSLLLVPCRRCHRGILPTRPCWQQRQHSLQQQHGCWNATHMETKQRPMKTPMLSSLLARFTKVLCRETSCFFFCQKQRYDALPPPEVCDGEKDSLKGDCPFWVVDYNRA